MASKWYKQGLLMSWFSRELVNYGFQAKLGLFLYGLQPENSSCISTLLKKKIKRT